MALPQRSSSIVLYCTAVFTSREQAGQGGKWDVQDPGEDVVSAERVRKSVAINQDQPVDLPQQRRKLIETCWRHVCEDKDVVNRAKTRTHRDTRRRGHNAGHASVYGAAQ